MRTLGQAAIGLLSIASIGMLASAQACSCDGQTPVAPDVAVALQGLPEQVLLQDDDANTPGAQLQVVVVKSGTAAGPYTHAQLSNLTTGQQVEVDFADDTASALLDIEQSAAGTPNVLEGAALDDDGHAVRISQVVTGLLPPVPLVATCAFEQPAADAVVLDDDSATPGRQVLARIACVPGDNLDDALLALLAHGTLEVRAQEPDGTALVTTLTLLDGVAEGAIEAPTAGTLDLTATLLDPDAILAQPATTTVRIGGVTTCTTAFTAPADDTTFTLADADVDPLTDGFQIFVDADAPGCIDDLTLVVGVTNVVATPVSDRVRFTVTLPDGDTVLILGDQTRTVHVDRTPPALVVDAPLPGTLTDANDTDGVGCNGITVPLSGTSEAPSVDVELVCDSSATPLFATTLPVVDGAFASTLPQLAADVCTLTVRARDDLDNAAVVDVPLTVQTDAPSLALSILSDRAPLGTLAPGEDEIAGQAAFDVAFSLTTSGLQATGAATLEALDDTGAVLSTRDLGTLDAAGTIGGVVALPFSSGVRTLRVRVTDAGCGDLVATQSFLVDVSAAPVCTAFLTSPADGAVFDATSVDADVATPGFQTLVTASAVGCSDPLTLVVGAASFVATPQNDVANFTVTLPDGAHALTLGASIVNVTVDRTPPVVVVESPRGTLTDASDTDGNGCNGLSVLAQGTSDAASVDVAVACNAVASPIFTTTATVTAGRFSTTLTGLPAGTCTMTTSARDAVGNATRVDVALTIQTSGPTITVAITSDDTPADGVLTGPEDAGAGTSAYEVAYLVQAANVHPTGTATLQAKDAGGAVLATKNLAALDVNTAQSGVLSLPFVSRTVQFVVSATDTGCGAIQATRTLDLDVTPPAIVVLTPPTGSVVALANDASAAPGLQATLSATVSGEAPGSSVAIALVGPGGPLSTTCTPITGVCSANVTLIDGSWTATFSAVDPLGNSGSVSTTFTVDSLQPALSALIANADANSDGIVSLAESGGVAPSSTSFTASFTAGTIESGQTVTLVEGNTPLATSTVNGAGAATFANVTLADGPHTLAVRATDASGNGIAAGAPTLAIVVDTTPPSLSILAPSNGASIGALPFSLLVSSNEANAAVVVTDVGSSTQIAAGTTDGGGAATLSVASIPDGTRTVRVTITDAAGNPTSSTISLVVAASTPIVSLTSPATGTTAGPLGDAAALLPGFQVTFGVDVFGADPASVVEIVATGSGVGAVAQVIGTVNAPGNPNTTSSVTIDGTFSSDDTYTIVARARNAANTAGTSSPISLTVDVPGLDVSVVTPGQPAAASGAFAFGVGDVGSGNAILVVDAPLATSAQVFVNGSATAAATSNTKVGGFFVLPFAAIEGSTGTFRVDVTDTLLTGTTGTQNFLVDGVAPAVQITRTDGPADPITGNQSLVAVTSPQIYTRALDRLPGLPPGSAGVTTHLEVTTSECETGTLRILDGRATPQFIDLGATSIDATGVGVFTPTVVDPREHNAETWTAQCTDVAGNVGTATLSVLVDTIAPTVDALVVTKVGADRAGSFTLTTTAPADSGAAARSTTSTLNVFVTRGAGDVADRTRLTGRTVHPLGGGQLASLTQAAGSAVSLAVSNLAFDTTWNFVPVAVDDVGNESLGNTQSATLAVPRTTIVRDDGIAADPSITGIDNDIFGAAVSTGDVDGDGNIDLLVGAPQGGGAAGQGSVRLLLGPIVGGVAAREVVIDGDAANDFAFGVEAEIVPDLDGDARDDIAIFSLDLLSNFDGRVTIVYGAAALAGTITIDATTSPSFVRIGAPQGINAIGRRIRALGDIDGDGKSETALIDGADSTIHIVPGGGARVGARTDVATLAGVVVLQPPANAGFAMVAPAGRVGTADDRDIDNDGKDDFFVCLTDNGSVVGSVLMLLSGQGLPTGGDLSTVGGAFALARTSLGLAAEGTFCQDLVVADNVLVTTSEQGIEVVPFAASGLNAARAVRLAPPATRPSVGTSFVPNPVNLLAPGDWNGDGAVDVVVTSASGAMAVFGPLSLLIAGDSATLEPNLVVAPFNPVNQASCVAGGDLDGDGNDELLFGDTATTVTIW